MNAAAELCDRTIDAIDALLVVRSHDIATTRLAHASLLTAQTLECWWLPWLDGLAARPD